MHIIDQLKQILYMRYLVTSVIHVVGSPIVGPHLFLSMF